MVLDVCWKYIDISNTTGVHKYKKEIWIRKEWRA